MGGKQSLLGLTLSVSALWLIFQRYGYYFSNIVVNDFGTLVSALGPYPTCITMFLSVKEYTCVIEEEVIK